MTSTNMGWNEPVVSASTDTWGDLLNAILDNLDGHVYGLIKGLTLSAAGSTATFGIAAGAAAGMVLSSAYTKTTSAWGVGTGQGSLDTGAIANSTWYHCYIIQRSDTGVVDILVSLSASSPTMPSNYDRKRRIGSLFTDGSAQWVKFTQVGDEFLWDVPVQDVSAVVSSAAQSKQVSVPTGVVVNALIQGRANYIGATEHILISSLAVADTTPSNAACNAVVSSSAQISAFSVNIRTNTSGQVRLRGSTTDATITMNTHGWIDRRGRD